MLGKPREVDTRVMQVLVVEDDPAVRASVAAALRREGYVVELAGDGAEALDRLVAGSFDSVVLDVLMPRLDGLEVCRRLRARGDFTPVLMLTARNLVRDRVDGLDAGADDYLVKPFAVEELRARVRALVRRRGASWLPAGGSLSFADLRLDGESREVRRGGRLIELTRTEFALLELFLGHPGQVLTRAVIYERVWGYDFGPASNALWVYVSHLRRKLEAGGGARVIHNVRGVGYVLREAR
jgi:two-component system, OmpR family, response regulator MprA